MFAYQSGAIGRAVRDYTGLAVLSLDVVPDPVLPAVYAIRAVLDRGQRDEPIDPTDAQDVAADDPYVLEFLVRNVLLQRVTADDLEEVEFTAWPPESSAHDVGSRRRVRRLS